MFRGGGTVTTGSIFTGSEAAHDMLMSVLQVFARRSGVSVEVVHMMCVEAEAWKRRWILDTKSPRHLFAEASDLSLQVASTGHLGKCNRYLDASGSVWALSVAIGRPSSATGVPSVGLSPMISESAARLAAMAWRTLVVTLRWNLVLGLSYRSSRVEVWEGLSSSDLSLGY